MAGPYDKFQAAFELFQAELKTQMETSLKEMLSKIATVISIKFDTGDWHAVILDMSRDMSRANEQYREAMITQVREELEKFRQEMQEELQTTTQALIEEIQKPRPYRNVVREGYTPPAPIRQQQPRRLVNFEDIEISTAVEAEKVHDIPARPVTDDEDSDFAW